MHGGTGAKKHKHRRLFLLQVVVFEVSEHVIGSGRVSARIYGNSAESKSGTPTRTFFESRRSPMETWKTVKCAHEALKEAACFYKNPRASMEESSAPWQVRVGIAMYLT